MGKTIEEFVAYLKNMTQEEHNAAHICRPPAIRRVCDFQVCIGVDELKQTLRTINDSRWAVISVTQFEEEYTVFFVRSEYV